MRTQKQKHEDGFVYSMKLGGRASKVIEKRVHSKNTFQDNLSVKEVVTKDKKQKMFSKQQVMKKVSSASNLPDIETHVESDKLAIGVERVHDVIRVVGADKVIDVDDLGTKTLRSSMIVLSLLLKSPIYNLIDDRDKQQIYAIREDGETL